MNNLSLSLASMKTKVRETVSRLGGVDGVAAVVEKGRSTVGRWMNINEPDFPTLDSVYKMDETSLAMGHDPLILKSLAHALGYELRLKKCTAADSDDLHEAICNIVKESSDVQLALMDALRDNVLTKTEKNHIRNEIADLQEILTALDQKIQVQS